MATAKISGNAQIKLLHDLVEEMTGEGNGRMVQILFGKKDVNEFSIAKKMDLTINQVRNILYKLSADGLVSFIRKKDKRKGWYIYYWTLKTEKCLEKLEQSLSNKIEELQQRLQDRETKRFYICHGCGIEVTEEIALEHGFTCEECAEVYELSDNTNVIKETKARITRIEKDLELIRGELNSIREKEKKKRARAEKKAKAEAEAKKALLKAARAAARKKLNAEKKKVKKTTKKTTKTKTKKTAKKAAKKVKKKTTKKVAKKITKRKKKKVTKKTAKAKPKKTKKATKKKRR